MVKNDVKVEATNAVEEAIDFGKVSEVLKSGKPNSSGKAKPTGLYSFKWISAKELLICINLGDGKRLLSKTVYKDTWSSGVVHYAHSITDMKYNTLFTTGRTTASIGGGHASDFTKLGYEPSKLNSWVLFVRAEANLTRPKED